MSLVKCRLAIISWPIGSFAPKKSTSIYLNLGEIYDEKVKSNLLMLEDLHRSLKFVYPFRIKKTSKNIKLYNEEDFSYFRQKFKLTPATYLHNYKTSYISYDSKANENKTYYGAEDEEDEEEDEEDKKSTYIVFRTPCLYDITCMEPLFTKSKRVIHRISPSLQTKIRVFIVMPYNNPIIRGEILDACISLLHDNNYLFLLIGDQFGKNKTSTSTLMKRYLLSSGIPSNNISKSLYDHYPDSIIEAFDILPFLLDVGVSIETIYIASLSADMKKNMNFIRNCKYNTKMNIRYICE